MAFVSAEIVQLGIAVLTLNRPTKKNALSIALRDELTEQLERWASNPEVKLVMLTGAGGAFSAGFDLLEFTPELLPRVFQSSARYHRAVWSFPKPTIALVNGPALGGGFDLATLCDLRVVSSTAVFGHPEIKLGAPPLMTPLRWLVGEGRAREICFTGRHVNAEEAHRIGLATEVISPERLLARGLELAACVLEAPEAALATTKAYMVSGPGRSFEECFVAEHDDVFRRLLDSGDAH